MKYFPWVAIAFVAVAIIAALFFIGSPAHQRLVRFDERRLGDLQGLQYQISSYFAAKGKLPATLAEMKGFEGFVVPVDPENDEEYEYAVKSPMQFQLCANFALAMEGREGSSGPDARPSMPYPKTGAFSENWEHPAGRGCFDITLEKPASGTDRMFPPAVTVKPAV